ncbi:hypothetical protein [Pseudomonas parasichuanensis]|uniref:hypothetical protein n=1 Tax=Pseudomonas parasichuanensis TaxID=2892329 RepID=UPI001F2AAAA6|nr:hypothetical protein [Pseudomonas parasichuanensis]
MHPGLIELRGRWQIEVGMAVGAVGAGSLGGRVAALSDKDIGIGLAVVPAGGFRFLASAAPFMSANIGAGKDQVVRWHIADRRNEAAVDAALAWPWLTYGRDV